MKPHDHDHGPIDAPIEFEESHTELTSVKRSESVSGETDEIRTPKKIKQQVVVTKEQQQLNDSNMSSPLMSPDPVKEDIEMSVEPSSSEKAAESPENETPPPEKENDGVPPH